MEKYYTSKEAAERLRLPYPTFVVYRDKKMIKGSKPGKRWIFSESDLEEFYRNHKK